MRYQVIINAEEQYALYPAELEPPDGWRPDGCAGTEQECVAHVDEHWTDLRPQRLRALR